MLCRFNAARMLAIFSLTRGPRAIAQISTLPQRPADSRAECLVFPAFSLAQGLQSLPSEFSGFLCPITRVSRARGGTKHAHHEDELKRPRMSVEGHEQPFPTTDG